MTMKFNVHLTLMLVLPTLAASEDPIVHTPLGSIEGRWDVSRSGRRFQAYEGIPYALPPIGELRFEPPQPVNSWMGVLPTKSHSSPCVQYVVQLGSGKEQVTGSEDCLYMHVYTNFEGMSNETLLLPVIIYVYGGGFQSGDSIIFQPHYLMDNDLVYVIMNYRLGPFGFLSTGDEVVSGNMGLKDQALAIKWVSKYITSFGGNPNQVTLAGFSSGAASTHLHLLSPMSRGLFHRGISGSGSALNSWTLSEASSERSKKLGALMGCPTSDNKLMIRCLKSRPANTICDSLQHFFFSQPPYINAPLLPFGPVVEKGSEDPFLDKSPIEIICNGDAANLPWILSDDTEEGIYPATPFLYSAKGTEELDENWEIYAPHVLDYNYTIPKSEHASVAKRIRHHYLRDKHIDNSTTNELIRMFGDRIFASAVVMAAQKQARLYNSPVWFYLYGYRAEYSTIDKILGTDIDYGVSHTDEIEVIFHQSDSKLHREEDIQMSLAMVKMWYSFIKTGLPDIGVNWTPIDGTSDTLDYLMISGPGQYVMESDSNLAENKFWRTIDFNDPELPALNFSNCDRIS